MNQQERDRRLATMSHSEFPDSMDTGHLRRLQDPNRLESLAATQLLDTLPEEAFDRVTRLATRLLGVPVGLLSLVDAKRQFFKSQAGLSGDVARDSQTPLSHSFCQYVVTEDRGLAVEDAREHPLLRDNCAITDLNVIAYMGEPVHAPDGAVIGSFCAIDTLPRNWTAEDQQALRDLADIVESELRLRSESRRNALLLREMQHRAKNLFTVSNSLVRLSAQEAGDKDELSATLQSRLHALSASHDLALGDGIATDGGGLDLAQLVQTALAPYGSTRCASIRFEGPSLTISKDAITYLALSLHELATNASKYGALSGRGGALNIRWSLDDGNVRLVWEEATEIADAETARGFGTDLLENAISFGLGGAYARDVSASGLVYTFDIPCSACG